MSDGFAKLCRGTATVTEMTGEDAAGEATTRVTTHAATAFVEYTLRERLNADGSARAGSGFVALHAAGFGDTWSAKPGDEVTIEGTTRRVTAVVPLRRPDGTLHHVEVECA